MSKLTVVVPTYNRPDYLAECLESIAAQTYRDFRLVVLDNASSADYGPVLRQLESMGGEYVRNAENVGAYGNHTLAIEIAMQSEFALVFHDDDLMHPEMLEWEVMALESDPALAWVACESYPFEDGSTVPYSVWNGATGTAESVDRPTHLVRLILQDVDLNFGSVMYRSRSAREVHPDMETFRSLADRPLLVELAQHSPVGLIREPLVLYRHHGGQQPYNTACTEAHAVALMQYYQAQLAGEMSRADHRLLRRHSTNYLLHVYAAISPDCRDSIGTLVANARRQGLFSWSDLNGQGVAALARVVGIDDAYGRVRPILGHLRRALKGRD